MLPNTQNTKFAFFNILNKRCCFFSPPEIISDHPNNISQATYLAQNNGPSSDQATTVVSYLAEYYVENYLQTNNNNCINRQHSVEFQNNYESDEEQEENEIEHDNSQNSERDDTLTPHHNITSNFQNQVKISDSGYPSFNDVQKSVKYKSGANTNFMKQLDEMQGFDANFTEFKNYDENEENNETRKSSSNSTYYEQMESPFGVTIQKTRTSNNNQTETEVKTDEELNCGIM